MAAIPEDALSGKYYGDSVDIKHPALREIAQALSESGSLTVVTPEYNGGVPGALKLFIDMLPGRDYNLVGRSVCFVGIAAGDWGGLRPVEQLESIFLYRKAFLFPERVLVRRCDEALDADGNITDEQVRRRLEGQAERFTRFADRLKPLQSMFRKDGNPAALEHPEVMGA